MKSKSGHSLIYFIGVALLVGLPVIAIAGELKDEKEIARMLASAVGESDPSTIDFSECIEIRHPKADFVYAIYHHFNNEIVLVGEAKQDKPDEKLFVISRAVLPQRVPGITIELNCHRKTIILTQKWAFRAFMVTQSLAWDGKHLRAIKLSKRDKSEEAVANALSWALKGDDGRAEYIDAPQHYLNRSVAEKALQQVSRKSEIFYNRGDAPNAALILESVFDWTARVYSLSSARRSEYRKSGIDLGNLASLELWLHSWKGFKIPLDRYVPPLNDFGFYLQKIGENERAMLILEAVLKEDPQRTPAYLNLADALWDLKRSEEAKMAYQTYVIKMKEAGREKSVPSYVLSRLT
jgi:tetratricopeptide (TPR) repeat protein